MEEVKSMPTKKICATLQEKEEKHILEFDTSPNKIDVDLSSTEGQNGLRKLFSNILEELISSEVEFELKVQPEYTNRFFIEVCEEYINALNVEIVGIKEQIKKEINAD